MVALLPIRAKRRLITSRLGNKTKTRHLNHALRYHTVYINTLEFSRFVVNRGDIRVTCRLLARGGAIQRYFVRTLRHGVPGTSETRGSVGAPEINSLASRNVR